MSFMRAALVLVAVSAASAVCWADLPPPRPAPASSEACRLDSDCEVSTFAGCCGSCCPIQPEARTHTSLEAERRRCAVIDCAMPSCTGLSCEAVRPPTDFKAVCRALACTLVEARATPPPAAPATCRTSADCVVTSWACCGSCCPLEPRAESKAALAQEQAACGAKPCPMMKPCRPGQCTREPAPPSAFVPACVGGRCVAEPSNATPSFECRGDTECTLTYPPPPPGAPCHSSPCGCCPGTEPTAVPALGPRPQPLTRPVPGPAPAPPPGQPPFGLSEGRTRTGPPPQCSPCPAPAEAHAACRGGRCVVVPRVQRIERR